jgi:hypothetical protein
MESDKTVVPSIGTLLKARCPAAICLAVVPSRFDSLNSHARGRVAHIGVKIEKLFPSFADLHPLGAVVLEGFHVRVFATI